MTGRERLLKVFQREKPDRIPWCADLTYWQYAMQCDGTLEKKYQGDEGLFNLHRDTGATQYLQGIYPYKEQYDGVKILKEVRGNEYITKYITPVGELEEVWEYQPKSYCFSPKVHPVKSIDDFPILKYIVEHTTYEADYSKVELYNDLKGDIGLTSCFVPKSPFLELSLMKMGYQDAIYAIADDKDAFEELLAIIEKKNMEAVAITLESGCDLVWAAENFSAEIVGLNFYERYLKEYYKKLSGLVRAAGKYSFMHMDGTLGKMLPEVSQSGFDALEALTPVPQGDLTIEEIAAQVLPGVVLIGGIPGSFFTDQISDDMFDQYVINAIKVLRKRPHSVLGVADQVMPGSRFARVKRVAELVEEYGTLEW